MGKTPLEMKDNSGLAIEVLKCIEREFKRKNNVILDGVREAYLIKNVESTYNTIVFAVNATKSLRYHRFVDREYPDGQEAYVGFFQKEFNKKTKEEKLVGAEGCMELADVWIDNN
jgi:hypothetical protein